MSSPVAGKRYVAQAGDTLRTIAGSAYGDQNLWTIILNGNDYPPQTNPEVVPQGTVLNIPVLPGQRLKEDLQQSVALQNDVSENISIVINGVPITPTSAQVVRKINTCADGFMASVPFEALNDEVLAVALRPFAYPAAKVFVNGELVLSGRVYSISPRVSEGGRSIGVGGFSYSADIVDSVIKPPYEANNITLEDRVRSVVQPTGIGVRVFGDVAGQFSRVTAESTETIFSHISKLAKQRGSLISSTPDGEIAIIQATTTGETVGTIEESETPLPSQWSATFDGRKRFNSYRAIGQSPQFNSKPAIAKDPVVPLSRFKTFSSDETTQGDIQASADWERSKTLADSLSLTFPVNDWTAPDGTLFKENTLINIVSETLFAPDGFVFLISGVEYRYENGGRTCILTIVPPEVYTKMEIKEPWTI